MNCSAHILSLINNYRFHYCLTQLIQFTIRFYKFSQTDRGNNISATANK